MTTSAVSYERVVFSGHETFPLRYTWLPKAVQQVRSTKGDVFAREDALVRLGVGKNMVKAIRHWALACAILAEEPIPNSRDRKLVVTPLGQRLFADDGWDPYLEDPATLWLLHWQLASRPERATTWYWVFSHCPQPEFTKDELLAWLLTVVEQSRASRASEASLRRDIDCFTRTYVASKPSRSDAIEDSLDCPLVELELLREFGARGAYLLQRSDQPTLPDEVFAYALVAFLGSHDREANTVALDEIAYAPGSPGRVFSLSEDSLLARLESLRRLTKGALTFDETAGMRQLLRTGRADPMAILDRYFKRAAA